MVDELGDLTADAQARLLRFLSDRTYERVGEAKERRGDVRLIAATNRALEDDVRDGRFREDLLFRLNVITLTVPPLRDRREDLLPMARHYLNFFERRQGRQHLTFSPACEEAITSYPWPGNLRELRNAVERAVILCPSSVIEAADLGVVASGSESGPPKGADGGIALGAECRLRTSSGNTSPAPRRSKRRPARSASTSARSNANGGGTAFHDVFGAVSKSAGPVHPGGLCAGVRDGRQ